MTEDGLKKLSYEGKANEEKHSAMSAQKSEKDKTAIITCVVNDYDMHRWGVFADNIIVEE